MKRLDKLNDSDLTNDNHFPVQAVFNELYEEQFLDTLVNYISEGHGFSTEYGACVFPDDMDEYEVETRGSLDGVEFGLHNGLEVIIDYKEFYFYLEKVCAGYEKDYPQDTKSIKGALAKYRLRYNI